MEKHREKALENFRKGYNCAQSVVLAFDDILPYGSDVLARFSCDFGGGVGHLHEVCGTVCGAAMIIGVLYGFDEPRPAPEKLALYARFQEIAAQFKEANGSVVCRELLGIGQNKDVSPDEAHSKKRPCSELVAMAADLLDQYIEAHPVEVK